MQQGGPAPQRARAAGGGGGYARNRAIQASMYYKRKYPGWGRVYIRPGTEIGKFGSTYRTATTAQRAERRRLNMHGQGAYNYPRMVSRAIAPYMEGIGGGIGASLGPEFAPMGAMAGSMLGRIMGRGAYTQTNNLIPNGVPNGTIPTFRSSGDETGALSVLKEEYIGDVLATADFVNDSFQLNPGDPGLFPWLSQIAQNYEEYEFQQLIFFYKSVASDTTIITSTASSSNLGTVIMAVNYNASAPSFTNKDDMMSYCDAKNGKITENIAFGVECDRMKKALGGLLYIAPNGSVPVGEDPKLYNAGTFQIATNQCQSVGGQIGELWVSYNCILRKPKLSVTKGAAQPISTLQVKGKNTLTGVHSDVLAFAPVDGQFNNIEDINYASVPTPPTAIQVQFGLWNPTSPNKLPTNNGADPPVRTNITLGQDRLGWNYHFGSQIVTAGGNGSLANDITYMFPPWLQIGTYDVTVVFEARLTNDSGIAGTITNGASTMTVLTSSGVTANNERVTTFLNAVGGSGLTNEAPAGFVFNGSFTLKKSFNGYAEMQYLRLVYDAKFQAATAGTYRLRASSAQKSAFKLSMINPGIVAANAAI